MSVDINEGTRRLVGPTAVLMRFTFRVKWKLDGNENGQDWRPDQEQNSLDDYWKYGMTTD